MSASIDFMANPFTDNGINKQSAMHNYLGYQPTMQSKSEHFHNYMTYKPIYHVTANDYDLPSHKEFLDGSGKYQRNDFSTYSFPGRNLSAQEIKHYKTILNNRGAHQVEFKDHELFGYIESLT